MSLLKKKKWSIPLRTHMAEEMGFMTQNEVLKKRLTNFLWYYSFLFYTTIYYNGQCPLYYIAFLHYITLYIVFYFFIIGGWLQAVIH